MLREAFIGTAAFFGYYLAGAVLLVAVRFLFRLSGERFRKMLHFLPVFSIFVALYTFETWQLAAVTPLVFAAFVYAAISWFEGRPQIMKALEERRKGEIRSSAVLAFITMAVLISVFWGGFGPEWKHLIVAAVMAWGFGDAAAALVGTTWGRHTIRHPWVDGKKTREGAAAMLAASGLAIFITLMLYDLPWSVSIATAVVVAPVSAGTELVSHRGLDTVTVPVATAVAAFGMAHLLLAVGAIG